MSKKRYIDTKIWKDNYFNSLDPIEKLLFFWILTNSDTSICGIFEVSIKHCAVDTGIDAEMILKLFERLQEDEKIYFEQPWLVIRNFLKHQNCNSSKIQKGIEIELSRVPDHLIGYLYGIDTLIHLNLNFNSNLNTNGNFTPPSIEEIQSYLDDKCIFCFTAEQFYYFYDSKGWMVGKNKMKSWKSAVNVWVQNNKKEKKDNYDVL